MVIRERGDGQWMFRGSLGGSLGWSRKCGGEHLLASLRLSSNLLSRRMANASHGRSRSPCQCPAKWNGKLYHSDRQSLLLLLNTVNYKIFCIHCTIKLYLKFILPIESWRHAKGSVAQFRGSSCICDVPFLPCIKLSISRKGSFFSITVITICQRNFAWAVLNLVIY